MNNPGAESLLSAPLTSTPKTGNYSNTMLRVDSRLIKIVQFVDFKPGASGDRIILQN
jgi:hypothetical protein